MAATTPLQMDADTKLTAKRITSIYTSSGISSVMPTANEPEELIGMFPTIATSLKHTDVSHHIAKYYITPAGPKTHVARKSISKRVTIKHHTPFK